MKLRERSNIVLEIKDKIIDILVGNSSKITFEGSLDLEEDICEDGYIRDVEKLANILSLYFEKNNIKEKYISFIIFGSDVVSRNIQVPHMKKGELHKNIQFEISEVIANREDYYVDYEVIKEIKDDYGKIKKDEVLLAGCVKEKIDLLVSLSEALEKELDTIDILTNTLNKILINSNINYYKRDIGILYLGYNFSNISIANDGDLKLDRTIPFGVENVLKELKIIAKDNNLTYEQLKRELNKNELDIEKVNEDYPRVMEVINKFLELIYKTIRFYNSGKSEKAMDKLLVFSKIDLKDSFIKYIKEYLNVEIKYIKSPEDVGIKVKAQNKDTFKYLSLYGLFLRR